MCRILILLLVSIFFSCDSKNNTSKIEIPKEKSKTKIIVKDSFFEKKLPSVIFDTLVFEKNMNGSLLREKFKNSSVKFDFYNKFIHSKNINQLITIKEKHSETEINYLGELKDLDGKNSYHVITNFHVYGIGEMLSPRGRSEVAFVNKKNNQIMVYDVGMPILLPIKVENNILYFDVENTKMEVSILGGLAPLLCIPENGCYECVL